MPTYHVFAQGVAFASAKSMVDAFQSAAGINTLRMWRIYAFNNLVTSVTGVVTTMVVRTQNTAVRGGSLVAMQRHRRIDPLPGAAVTCGTNRTVAAGTTVRRFLWINDEPAIANSSPDEWELSVANAEVWSSGYADSNVEPLACVPGVAQGIDLQQSGSSAVGTMDAELEFTL